jgi:hypothetical protein
VSKIFVNVIVKCTTEGELTPLRIVWTDGKEYEIDRVLDIRRAASLKGGGAGLRYLCRIKGQKKYLWLEENKWFVEGK